MKITLIAPIILILIFFKSLYANSDFQMLSTNRISGLIPDIEDGYGVAFNDFNNDNFPDIYLICFRHLNRLLINNGGIMPFVDRTIYSGLGGYLMPRGQTNLELGAGSADFDNDGRPDLFLAGWGQTTKLLRNEGQLVFEDVSNRLNLNGRVDANQGLWFDANNDGYLDIYISDEHHSNRLMMNNGRGHFFEQGWSIAFRDTATSQGVCHGDFDGDGDSDLYVANWFHPDYLLINDGKGRFKQASFALPTLQQHSSSNSARCADLDNDGDLDLMIASRDGYIYYYRNVSQNHTILFEEIKSHHFYYTGSNNFGLLLNDFNQDGWLDCFISLKGHNRLYLNDGKGNFNPDFDESRQNAYSTGAAAGDIDNDGDLDIVVSNKDELSQIYLNPCNNTKYLKVRLTGVSINRQAIGTKLFLYHTSIEPDNLFAFQEISTQQGYLSSGMPSAHFGVGGSKKLALKIVLPSGKTITKQNLWPGHNYHFREYGVLNNAFLIIQRFGYHLQTLTFWTNFVLMLVFILLLLVYFNVGARRYRWRNLYISIQLTLFIALTIILFVVLRDQPLQNIFAILDVISFAAVGTSIAYSEYQTKRQRRHIQFRQSLQDLSNRMIYIRQNRELLDALVTTVGKHDNINHVYFLLYQKGLLNIFSSSGAASGPQKQSFELKEETSHHLPAIMDTNTASVTLHHILEELNCNRLLPVQKDQQIHGMLALSISNADAIANQQDLQYIQTLTNQTAIAIENNNYIRESADMARQLAEARVRQEYLDELEKKNRQLDQKNSELTHLFRDLQEKESQLIHSEKMASLGQLVAGISHELNNPISFIYANSKALHDYLQQLNQLLDSNRGAFGSQALDQFKAITDDIRSIVEDNIAGSHAVKEIIRNLKSFSRIDQADWKEARMSECIQTCLNILKPQISPNIEIQTRFEDDPVLYCNPGQMNQVFVNVISNALQALDQQGRIEIYTIREGNHLSIRVTDNGRGIAPEHLANIFDPFFTTKEVNEGTGLGLSISYSIIQKHNGNISVNSKPNAGTTFIIELPLT